MEKVRPWCGQPLDQGRLNNNTIAFSTISWVQHSYHRKQNNSTIQKKKQTW